MRYAVISQFRAKGIEEDDNIFHFDALNEALDYYRDGFKTMAETISDYEGEFTISLYAVDESEHNIMKRNNISTTINIM